MPLVLLPRYRQKYFIKVSAAVVFHIPSVCRPPVTYPRLYWLSLFCQFQHSLDFNGFPARLPTTILREQSTCWVWRVLWKH